MTQKTRKGSLDRKQAAGSLFDRAVWAYDSGDYRLSSELFSHSLSMGMENEVLLNNLGAAQEAMGLHDEALKSYQRAVAISPKYELAWHNLGNYNLNNQRFEEAVTSYRKALALNPERVETYAGLAHAFIHLGSVKKAASVISSLGAQAERSTEALLLQSSLYLDAGMPEEALKRAEEYVKRNPEAAGGHIALGAVHHEKQDYAFAISSFEKAAALDPDDEEVWNNMGYSYLCAGQLDKALECFNKAIEIDPRYKNAWYNKGYALHGADRLEEALLCYRQAISIDPDDRVLWNNLGNALYNLGGYADSIPKFVEAIRADPDYEIAWNNIGNALERMELFAEAIPFHDRSLEIRPDFDYALYAKGVCKAEIGDLEEASDLILESLELNPFYDEAWKARSRVARKLGRVDEALSAIEESIMLNPEFDEGWIDRGDLLLSTGDVEGAMTSYETALTCITEPVPNTAFGIGVLHRRARLLWRLGRLDEAVSVYDRLAAMGHLSPDAAEELMLLVRMTGSLSLPEAARVAVESSSPSSVKLTYARLLMSAGALWDASRILEGLDDEVKVEKTCLATVIRAILGDVSGASEDVRECVDACRDPETQRLVGEVLEAGGRMADARAVYEKLLDSRPSDYSVAISLARVLLSTGEAKRAARVADLAIGVDSRGWEAYQLKARALDRLGKASQAEELRELARELHHESIEDLLDDKGDIGL